MVLLLIVMVHHTLVFNLVYSCCVLVSIQCQ